MNVRHTVTPGMTFGLLTTEELIHDPKAKERKWLCRCRCGSRKVVRERNLKHGDVKSCGCLQRLRSNGCHKEDCRYHSYSGCAYFIVEGHTRTALHEDEGVDINNPCREYSPGEKVLLNVQPFTLHNDLR